MPATSIEAASRARKSADWTTAVSALRAESDFSASVRKQVSVTATGRLHLGFMDPSGRQARRFGSLGISLDRPATRVRVGRGDGLTATGLERERAEPCVERVAEHLGIQPDFKISIDQAIPSHSGLGSGTQLALAVGHAIAAMSGRAMQSGEIAALLGRGARSGIGIGAFDTGGVLLDGGHDAASAIPPIISRLDFPDAWRILLIYDEDVEGVHGACERGAFATLPDFPEEDTADLCRRILLRALPALAEANFLDFCAEVGHLQRRMGDYFAPMQGGRYASAAVGNLLQSLEAEGRPGIGQSSWGPTGFVLAPTESEGKVLCHHLERSSLGAGLRFALAAGRNQGALIEIDDKRA